MEDSHITHEEVLGLLGISKSEAEQGRIEESERRKRHNKASDYLTTEEMRMFDMASRKLQVAIIGLITEIENQSITIENVREHLDRTPL